MRIKSAVACAFLGLALTASAAHAASTFDFQFDNSGGGPDGTIGSPIVGTGSFVSPVDLSSGTYALEDLTGFTMNFDIAGDMFSQADIATPISEVAVLVSDYGSGERLIFTENGANGDGGPDGGSLDLINSSNANLTFEPTYAGGHNLYQEFSGVADPFGNYLALSPGAISAAPEPSTWLLLLAGIGGIGMTLRRKKAGSALAAVAA